MIREILSKVPNVNVFALGKRHLCELLLHQFDNLLPELKLFLVNPGGVLFEFEVDGTEFEVEGTHPLHKRVCQE